MPHIATRLRLLAAAGLLAGALSALLAPHPLRAQSPRMVLVEEATNASCGPCALQNPAFEHFLQLPHNEAYIIPVAFHSRFPGPDVMNAAEAEMHNGRVTYYGISGVPTALVNGVKPTPSGAGYAGAPSDTVALSRAAAPLYGTMSPITIAIDEDRSGANSTATIDVSSTTALSGKKLFTVLVERHHHYDNAGTNGEREFMFVARKMFPNTGIDLTLAAGEKKSFDINYAIDPEWNRDELYLVAFVQDPSSKEVLQAGTNRGKLGINTSARMAQVPSSNDGVEWSATLETNNPGNYTVAISSRMPAGWEADVMVNDANVEHGGTVTVAGDASTAMRVAIIPSASSPGKGWVTVTLSGDMGTMVSRTFRCYSDGLQALVLPRDEGNPTITDFYDLGMAKTGYSYAVVDVGDEDLFDLKSHVILYEVGKWALQKDEITKLNQLFDQGARVFMIGAEIAFGLADPRNTDPATPRDATFLRERLHAAYVSDAATPFVIYGATGDPIGDGLGFQISNGVQNQDTPDQIAPLHGAKAALYYGNDQNKVAGIRYSDTKNRLVYFGFGLEGVGDVNKRGEVMRRSIAWLLGSEITSSVAAEPAMSGALLGAILPNPASGIIEIPLTLERPAHCAIALYNIRGERVATIADAHYEPGTTSARFDATQVPPGIYTVVVSTPERTASRMISIVR